MRHDLAWLIWTFHIFLEVGLLAAILWVLGRIESKL